MPAVSPLRLNPKAPFITCLPILTLPGQLDPVLAEHLWRCPGADMRRRLGRQAQVNENLADHSRIDDEAGNSSLTMTFRAVQDDCKKHPLDQLGPLVRTSYASVLAFVLARLRTLLEATSLGMQRVSSNGSSPKEGAPHKRHLLHGRNRSRPGPSSGARLLVTRYFGQCSCRCSGCLGAS